MSLGRTARNSRNVERFSDMEDMIAMFRSEQPVLLWAAIHFILSSLLEIKTGYVSRKEDVCATTAFRTDRATVHCDVHVDTTS